MADRRGGEEGTSTSGWHIQEEINWKDVHHNKPK